MYVAVPRPDHRPRDPSAYAAAQRLMVPSCLPDQTALSQPDVRFEARIADSTRTSRHVREVLKPGNQSITQ